jgi:hypothetical protein
MGDLRELRDTRQVEGEPKRRWFSSPDLDLIVWLDDEESLVGFQLCYDKTRGERALTWRDGRGYDHNAVDDGEQSPGQYKSTPILVAAAHFHSARGGAFFWDASAGGPDDIRAIVSELIHAYR